MPEHNGTSGDRNSSIEDLEKSGEYRVLRKLGHTSRYSDLGSQEVRRGLVLDVETTGLGAQQDRIIELAVIGFEYGADTGEVGAVDLPVAFLEDPGQPIPEDVVALTGITDEMVLGKRIDDSAVERLFEGAGVVIAHNASFDRPFVDRRLDVSTKKPWACSWAEVPWAEFGIRCAKLECLLPAKASAFVESHRAENDCLALLHVLAKPFSDGTVPMALLLASARETTVRVHAVGSKYEYKDVLKAHGYRWSPGEDSGPKAWWIDVREAQLEEELAWLQENGYEGRRGSWRLREFTAETRYQG